MITVYTCPDHLRVPSAMVRDKITWDGMIKVCPKCKEPLKQESGFQYTIKAEWSDKGTDNPITGTFTLDETTAENALATAKRAIEHHGPVDWVQLPWVYDEDDDPRSDDNESEEDDDE
jgi:hypothetical protein